ncbi:MAG: RidA family protein, partial [Planctomycetota bacterium]
MLDGIQARQITTEGDWFAPYFISLGYRLGDLIVLSGQASISRDGEIVGEGDFDAQAEQTFRNIETVLALEGAGLDDIFKVTIYLTDMGNFPKIMDLRQRWFTPPFPADTIVEVRSLALPELMIEIEVMAIAPGDGPRRVLPGEVDGGAPSVLLLEGGAIRGGSVLLDTRIGDGRPMHSPTQRPVPATKTDRSPRYREIALSTLRVDSVLPFALHARIEGEHIVYRREGLPFTETQRGALLENGIETLFVSEEQAEHYWSYLTVGIEAALRDHSRPLAERSRVLQESTERLSARVSSLPVRSENVELARGVVCGSLSFQGEGKPCLHALMEAMTDRNPLHARALQACQYGIALARE